LWRSTARVICCIAFQPPEVDRLAPDRLYHKRFGHRMIAR